MTEDDKTVPNPNLGEPAKRTTVGFSRALNSAESPGEVIGLAMGYASMCWSETPRGVFSSSEAAAASRAADIRVAQLYGPTLASASVPQLLEELSARYLAMAGER